MTLVFSSSIGGRGGFCPPFRHVMVTGGILPRAGKEYLMVAEGGQPVPCGLEQDIPHCGSAKQGGPALGDESRLGHEAASTSGPEISFEQRRREGRGHGDIEACEARLGGVCVVHDEHDRVHSGGLEPGLHPGVEDEAHREPFA